MSFIISYINGEKKNGYVISLDFEKAFDRVEHVFLFSVLGLGKVLLNG